MWTISPLREQEKLKLKVLQNKQSPTDRVVSGLGSGPPTKKYQKITKTDVSLTHLKGVHVFLSLFYLYCLFNWLTQNLRK